MNKKYAAALAAIAVLLTAGLTAAPALADTNGQSQPAQTPPTAGMPFMKGRHGEGMGRPGVFGSVTAVSGTTITVTDQRTKTSYTIDASNAKIMKAGAAATVSNIAVGDIVMADGTLSGTTLTAKVVMDGQPWKRGEMENKIEKKIEGADDKLTSLGIVGNGQPVVAGSVTAVSGTTITISNKAGATFTVDATTAKIAKAGAVTTVSNVTVGDMVIVQGTVNGSNITAASVIDQGTTPAPTTGTTQGANASAKAHVGFFGRIGGFFSHLFGG